MSHVIDRIKIERYKKPENVGYSGWMEPKDKSWILYFDLDGKPSHYYPERDKDGGVKDTRIELV